MRNIISLLLQNLRIWRGSRRDLESEIYGLRLNVGHLQQKLNRAAEFGKTKMRKLKEQHEKDRAFIKQLKNLAEANWSQIQPREDSVLILSSPNGPVNEEGAIYLREAFRRFGFEKNDGGRLRRGNHIYRAFRCRGDAQTWLDSPDPDRNRRARLSRGALHVRRLRGRQY